MVKYNTSDRHDSYKLINLILQQQTDGRSARPSRHVTDNPSNARTTTVSSAYSHRTRSSLLNKII